MNEHDIQARVDFLTRRYSGTSLDALVAVLCPILIPIRSLDEAIHKIDGQTHYRATFTLQINDDNRTLLQRGRTGKFVPGAFARGESPLWREIAKGRLIAIDENAETATGEIYTGGTRTKLERALIELQDTDFLEIDQYGAAAKVLSGLAEYHLVEMVQASGYTVPCLSGYHPHPLYVLCLLGLQARAGAGALRRRSG